MKLQNTNSKLQTNNNIEITNSKRYDLEERTYEFARACRDFVKQLPPSTVNFEYGKQLIRSSGSPAANYIEANEALSKKDFALRIRICRKEAKETCLWLRLCDIAGNLEQERQKLIKEASELRNIFTAILTKSGA